MSHYRYPRFGNYRKIAPTFVLSSVGLVVRDITSQDSNLLDEIHCQKHSLDAFHCNYRCDLKPSKFQADFPRQTEPFQLQVSFNRNLDTMNSQTVKVLDPDF